MRSEPSPAHTFRLQTVQVQHLHDVVQRETPVAKPRAYAHRGAAIHLPGACPFSVTAAIRFQRCDLRRHMDTHNGTRRYTCDVCYKRFGQQNHLRNHKLTHTGERPFACKVSKAGGPLNYRRTL